MLQLGKGTGTIGLDLTARLASGKTQADLQLHAADLMFNGAAKNEKPADVDLKAHWDGQILQADGRISGLDSRDATLTATVPMVRAAGSYLPKLAQSGPVSAQLRAQMQAARLMALLPVAEQSATGLLTASADVSGDIANPQLSGKIALANGSFTDYQTGTKLEKLNASIDASGGSQRACHADGDRRQFRHGQGRRRILDGGARSRRGRPYRRPSRYRAEQCRDRARGSCSWQRHRHARARSARRSTAGRSPASCAPARCVSMSAPQSRPTFRRSR